MKKADKPFLSRTPFSLTNDFIAFHNKAFEKNETYFDFDGISYQVEEIEIPYF